MKLLIPIKVYFFVPLIFATSCVGFQESDLDPNSTLSALRSALILTYSGSAPESPTFLTIKNNSIIESGFIIGKVAADATVEVSLDEGAFASANSLSSGYWKFPLPKGSNTWRLGSIHKISIRAVRRSFTSTESVISVRKGKNRDINGDGFTDLIVGTPTANSNFGQVNIFDGSENGIIATLASEANANLSGSAFGLFGTATAAGDSNGDGFADIISSAPRFEVGGNADNGRVYIFYGSEAGISSKNDNLADVIISGSGIGGWLGRSVAAGDLNADGYDEAIIGAYLQTGASGNIYIVNGRSDPIPTGIDTAVAITTLTGSASRLGESVEAADLNGDGIADLIGGAPFANNGVGEQGRVFIFNGSISGIPSGIESTANSIITGTNIVNSRLGTSIGYGDLNGDGIYDLILGAVRSGTNGSVYIFNGSTSGISSANDTAASKIITSTKASGLFGSSVRSADINGDGFQDLLVGSTGVSTNQGESYIFYGSGIGVMATNDLSANSTFTGTSVNGSLGTALTPFDYDSDSNIDLLIVAPGGSGTVYFFRNSGTSITSGPESIANRKIQGGTGFGSSLVH